MNIAEVILELDISTLNKPFTYIIKDEHINLTRRGMRVLVPFGAQQLEGYIINIKEEFGDTSKLKSIISLVDSEPIINEEMFKIAEFLEQNTLCYKVSALRVMLPSFLKAKKNKKVTVKMVKYVELNSSINHEEYIREHKSAKKQAEIINYLLLNNKISKRLLLSNINSPSSLKNLVDNGIVIETELEEYRSVHDKPILEDVRPKLNADQLEAVNEIVRNLEKPIKYLLYGVTGSGKTEVYLNVIESVIKNGKQAIMLVPEISLTPQIVDAFRRRFADKVAVLHSRLSQGEKYDEYRRVMRGEVDIVVGARSAVFAPFNNLGIVIIDEEHEDTYKQENHPRYHARDVAIFRGQLNSIPVVFGSATPSLESFARAKKGVYKLLTLHNRVKSKELPVTTIVDMHEEKELFSMVLIDKVNGRLEKKEQVVLMLNRRGYANYLSCGKCGHTYTCPHCDITLTYHKKIDTLKCHYCNYSMKRPDTCSECGSDKLMNKGIGTEQVEEMIKELFTDSRVIRMDYETTSRKGAHEKIIASFKNREYDILLGTQMIAKGLDFENVTLVGIINADTILNIPDFRSSEKTFQLITQVSGRSGRHKAGGEVVIQTFNSDHYAIKYAKQNDYIGFFNEEMALRHKLSYPPYYFIASILIKSKDYKLSLETSKKIGVYLRNNVDKSNIVLGPSASGILKINDYYRFQCIIKYKDDLSLKIVLRDVIDHYINDKKVLVEVDINPHRII